MIVGIAYHSPLDIIALLPIDMETSLCATKEADILISRKVEIEYKARLQIVFAGSRHLLAHNVPILDHGAWGKVLPITTNSIENLLNTGSTYESAVPDWVRTRK